MPSVNILLYHRQNPDTNNFIRKNLFTSFKLNIFGLLDDFSEEKIREMAATNPAKGVPVDLEDGSCVYVDHELLDHKARAKVKEIQTENDDATVMFCTIPWTELEDLDNVLCPSRIMEAVAFSVMPRGGKIGVVQPLAITAAEEIKHWQVLDPNVASASGVAEAEHYDDFSRAVSDVLKQGADILVLDCLGYTKKHYGLARKLTNKPIILPIDLIGRTLDSMISSI